MEARKAGTGIDGILLAAPIADLVALMVILGLTTSFFRSINKSAVYWNRD